MQTCGLCKFDAADDCDSIFQRQLKGCGFTTSYALECLISVVPVKAPQWCMKLEKLDFPPLKIPGSSVLCGPQSVCTNRVG